MKQQQQQKRQNKYLKKNYKIIRKNLFYYNAQIVKRKFREKNTHNAKKLK